MRAGWGRTHTAGQVRGPGVTGEGFLEEVGSTRPLKVSPEETGRGRCGHRAWEQTGLPAEATAVSAGGPPNGWREGGLDVGGGCPAPSAGDTGLSPREGSTAWPQEWTAGRSQEGPCLPGECREGPFQREPQAREERPGRPPGPGGGGCPGSITPWASCSCSPEPQARHRPHGRPRRADGATWWP